VGIGVLQVLYLDHKDLIAVLVLCKRWVEQEIRHTCTSAFCLPTYMVIILMSKSLDSSGYEGAT